MSIANDVLLNTIKSPEVLRQLSEDQLPLVCEELRQRIIETVSRYGGHFNANLGTVELTVALHYVYQTPGDMLVWDVGHQAYGHKMITERMEKFHTNRQYRGLSGFPNREESVYDTFGVGHSSTAISAGLGMAMAERIQGGARRTVAVVGDGALTGGMAFEGLNNLAVSDVNMLVIVNDNQMAIDEVTGGLSDHLAEISRERKLEIDTQAANLPNNFFTHLGLEYHGPSDGHDVLDLVKRLRALRAAPGAKVLHLRTVKGKGYEPAEKAQTTWHAPGQFDKITGERFKATPERPQSEKYQDVFGKTLVELAEKNHRIVGVTPAMPTGSSLTYMMEAFPERAFDVGIAEQHAVTFSAGLACEGMLPFCALYATFAQRAYDQIIHDVCIQNLPVVFCLDRAGCVGADGATHQGLYDIASLRCLPNMIIAAPMNEAELRNMMFTAQMDLQHPFAIRYPRGRGVMGEKWRQDFEPIPIGEARQLAEGEHVAILSLGHIGNEAAKAVDSLLAQGIRVAHYDMRFAKPLDEYKLHRIFQDYDQIITVEDGALKGGFGSAVLEFMAENRYQKLVRRLGAPDYVLQHGAQEEQYQEVGIDAASIIHAVEVLQVNRPEPDAETH